VNRAPRPRESPLSTQKSLVLPLLGQSRDLGKRAHKIPNQGNGPSILSTSKTGNQSGMNLPMPPPPLSPPSQPRLRGFKEPICRVTEFHQPTPTQFCLVLNSGLWMEILPSCPTCKQFCQMAPVTPPSLLDSLVHDSVTRSLVLGLPSTGLHIRLCHLLCDLRQAT
jgi:hypothetical protein